MKIFAVCVAAMTLAVLSVPSVAQDAETRFRMETGYNGPYVIVKPDGVPTPPFAFDAADDALLEEITEATFRYFWDSPNVTETGFVTDRGGSAISVAGVGFQFGAIVIGVERGYITRSQGERRVRRMLGALLESDQIRKEGMFFHFIQGQPLRRSGSSEISTIDTPLMYAGAMVAGGYFGGEIEQMVSEMIAGTDWNFFTQPASRPDYEEGLVSLSWLPVSAADPLGAGTLGTATWQYNSGEELCIYFVGAAGPDPALRLDPSLYYRVKRPLGSWKDLGPMVRKPSSGGTFLYTFGQVWIDYAGIAEAMGADRPFEQGFGYRAPTDFWENSRRHALLHRDKAINEAPGLGYTTLGPNAWGLSASDGPTGYSVPGLVPTPLTIPGAQVNDDVPPGYGGDSWRNGTLAIYGAGQMIMFTPDESVAALRHYRQLTDGVGQPLLWDDDLGFVDAYNLHVSPPWVASTRLAIDQGPMLLAIENARTGLIWDSFHKHPYARAAMERLGLVRAGDGGESPAGSGCGDAVLHDLGVGGGVAGFTGGYALGLNEAGAVTGVLRRLGDAAAFRWTPDGGIEVLPRLPGAGPARGIAINESGVVVGSAIASASADGPVAALWDEDGSIELLGSPAGTDGAVATGVDDAGRVAGLSFGPNGIRGERGFRYEAGTFVSFGTNPGEATGLAGNGFTAGNQRAAGGIRGYIYNFGPSVREPLPGDSWSEVYAVNTAGVAVGVSGDALARRAVRWLADGTPVEIPSLPGATGAVAFDVNEQGDVVGYCATPSGQRAFLWTAASGTVDLNDQLASGDAGRWRITQARGINDARQVAGVAYDRDAEAYRPIRLDIASVVAGACGPDLNGDCATDFFDVLEQLRRMADAADLRGPTDNRVVNGSFEIADPSDPSRPSGWAKTNNEGGTYDIGNTGAAPPARTGSRLVSIGGANGGGFNSWNTDPAAAAAHAPIRDDMDLTLELYYGIIAGAGFDTDLFGVRLDYFAGDGAGGLGASLGGSGDLEITPDLGSTPDWLRFRRTIPAAEIPAGARFARVSVFTFDAAGAPSGRVYVDDVAIYQTDPGYAGADYNGDGVVDDLDLLELLSAIDACE